MMSIETGNSCEQVDPFWYVSLKQAQEGSGIKLTINPKFYQEYSWANETEIVNALLIRPWLVPGLPQGIYLPGMGLTGHKGIPTAVILMVGKNGKLERRNIDVFAKPFTESDSAKMEYRNSNMVLRRGILTPTMLALLELPNDEAILISQLEYLAEPLSLRRLDYQLQDLRVYNPRDFLEDFVSFIAANVHEMGVISGDLHLGNIGFLYRTNRPPAKIIFDLETAMVLDDYELAHKKIQSYKNNEMKRRFEEFERLACEDMGTFLAHLNHSDFPMEESQLLKVANEIYRRRRMADGLVTKKERSNLIRENYTRVLKGLKQYSSR